MYGLMGMCNSTDRMHVNFVFYFTCSPFLIFLLNTVFFTSKALLIFEGKLDLCSVHQFVQLGKQSCKFIIVALLLHKKFFADTVIYFNMLCNHF